MSALSPPLPLLPLLLALLAAPAALAHTAESVSASQREAEHQPSLSLKNVTRLESGVAGGGGSNSSGQAVVTRISSLLRDLPTLKAAVIVACAFSALLIACLLLRVFRSLGHFSGMLGKSWFVGKKAKYILLFPPASQETCVCHVFCVCVF
ncbi:Fam174b [Phodopus roborovskii]|uniref:Fam174b protein n=1 Tax=Phodopus roborovskii TaxID=109678 RepID=A0AAV0AAM8_PHORO|nr:Fam174b [Phodopus roborovskii]